MSLISCMDVGKLLKTDISLAFLLALTNTQLCQKFLANMYLRFSMSETFVFELYAIYSELYAIYSEMP